MASAAAAFGKVARLYEFTPDEDDSLCFSCSWVLIMARTTQLELQAKGQLLQPRPGFRTWTDDFSNLFGILM
jgi:hypothetical protein